MTSERRGSGLVQEKLAIVVPVPGNLSWKRRRRRDSHVVRTAPPEARIEAEKGRTHEISSEAARRQNARARARRDKALFEETRSARDAGAR